MKPIDQLGFAPEVLTLLKSFAKDLAYYKTEVESDEGLKTLEGIFSCKLSSDDEFFALREKLPQNYQAFFTDHPQKYQLSFEESLQKVLCVVPAPHMYRVLLQLQTNGINCGLDTSAIIEQLKQWQKLCQFHISGAGFDWLELAFETLPDDLDTFGKTAYDFCPDIIEQGYVGPPLSPDAEPEDLFEAMDAQTPEDIGRFIARERILHCWWD